MAEDLNVAIISGKIEEVSQHEGVYYHRVTLPAIDEFHSPGAANVSSPKQLGTPGQMIKARAQVTGYARRFKTENGHGYDIRTRFHVA